MEAPMRRLALACILVAGCGGSGSPASSDPAPPAHGYQIKTPDYTVAAGEEKYMCYSVQLAEASDIAITAFQSFASDQVHHVEVFQALGAEDPGLNTCAGTFKLTWLPLFGGGTSVGGLKVPAGAGFLLFLVASLFVLFFL